jgi:hypothetical protein
MTAAQDIVVPRSILEESDLFKADKKTIDTIKVIAKIWEHHKNATFVSQLAEILW